MKYRVVFIRLLRFLSAVSHRLANVCLDEGVFIATEHCGHNRSWNAAQIESWVRYEEISIQKRSFQRSLGAGKGSVLQKKKINKSEPYLYHLVKKQFPFSSIALVEANFVEFYSYTYLRKKETLNKRIFS